MPATRTFDVHSQMSETRRTSSNRLCAESNVFSMKVCAQRVRHGGENHTVPVRQREFECHRRTSVRYLSK
eukprot:6130158-Prymnesium_polylepis.1